MIQRIQSVYFFLAALLSASGFAVPVLNTVGIAPSMDPVVAGNQVMHHTLAQADTMGFPVIIAFCVAILIPLIALSLYKNRPLQMRMGRVGILITTSAMALLVMRFGAIGKMAGVADVAPSVGMFLPIGSILFCILAVRAVKKDEALVRSADRIR